MQLSLVIPCYNEAANVAALYQRCRDTFVPAGVEYELIYVNDGSRDDTWAALLAVQETAHGGHGAQKQHAEHVHRHIHRHQRPGHGKRHGSQHFGDKKHPFDHGIRPFFVAAY